MKNPNTLGQIFATFLIASIIYVVNCGLKKEEKELIVHESYINKKCIINV